MEQRATLEHLELARADLTLRDNRWANDSSNNPNKYWSERQAARRRVRELTQKLKSQGDLEMTDPERLCAVLDAIVPDASNGQVIDHEGIRYRRRFFPEEKSRSGKTVTAWGRTWEKV